MHCWCHIVHQLQLQQGGSHGSILAYGTVGKVWQVCAIRTSRVIRTRIQWGLTVICFEYRLCVTQACDQCIPQVCCLAPIPASAQPAQSLCKKCSKQTTMVLLPSSASQRPIDTRNCTMPAIMDSIGCQTDDLPRVSSAGGSLTRTAQFPRQTPSCTLCLSRMAHPKRAQRQPLALSAAARGTAQRTPRRHPRT